MSHMNGATPIDYVHCLSGGKYIHNELTLKPGSKNAMPPVYRTYSTTRSLRVNGSAELIERRNCSEL